MPKVIQDRRLSPPLGPYCYAFRAGEYIFLGGTPGTTPDAFIINGIPKGRMAGETAGRADIVAQTAQAINSLKLAVEVAGGRWTDVLRLNLFVDDWREIGPFLDAYEKYRAPGTPAETLVGYGLYMPSMIMELEGLAGTGETTPIMPVDQLTHKYAPANAGRRLGKLLCLSALLPLDAKGEVLFRGNAVAQTEAILKKLGAILEKNGGSIRDTIRLRVFVRDVRDVAVVNSAISALFSDSAPVTTIVAAPLPIQEVTVMIEPTAYLGEKTYRDGPGNSRAVLAGDLMISNGIRSVDKSGVVRDPDNISKQVQNVLTDAKQLLKEFDMAVGDITQSQVTVSDFRDYDAYNVFYRDFVPFPFPARNTVEAGLGDLLQYGLRYQIEITAVRNASSDGLAVTSEENFYFKRLEIEKKAKDKA